MRGDKEFQATNNALGRVKVMFPNEHAVYLHDTPSKALFSKASRAFSHGCIRVENPFDFAEQLLGGDGPVWPHRGSLPAAMGDRSASTLIANDPSGVSTVTVRVSPAGSGSG